MYMGRRVVECAGVVSVGMFAGCTHATTLLRVIITPVLDQLHRLAPAISITIVVDDLSLTSVGGEERVAANLAEAGGVLAVLFDDVGLPLARDKIVCCGSTLGFARPCLPSWS